MKNYILAIFTIVSVALFAQEKPHISSSIIAFNKANYPEAKKEIDAAAEIINGKGEAGVDAKQMSKFLYYYGAIAYRISTNADPEIKALEPNGLDVAAEYFIKLLDYEKKTGTERFTEKALEQIPYITQDLTLRAHDKNEAEDFSGSADDFMKAYELKNNPALGEKASMDTTSYYYAGLTYIAAADYEKAAMILTDVLNMNYKGFVYTADNAASGAKQRYPNKARMDKDVELGTAVNPEISESVRINVYKSLLQTYLGAKDTEQFNVYLTKAREEFPGDIDLINMELQGYLDDEKFAEALSILETAIEKDPTNSIYYYVKGFIYQINMKDGDQALLAYQEVINLLDAKEERTEDQTKNLFEAWYMSGVVWYDRGKKALDEMGQLGMSSADQKKYKKLDGEKSEYFNKSLPYFERAHVLNDQDVETVKALWEVYRQKGDYEKVTEMKAKLDALTGQG